MAPQDKIHRTALNLFFRYGIRHVTMDEIAKELGMSKKTIYQSYREKDDLVTHLCEHELRQHELDFRRFAKTAKDPLHEIILISEKMRSMMQQINPAFFLDLKRYYPNAFARFQKFREECAYGNIAANIRKGMAAGYYRADLDADFVARYRLAQIDMLIFGDYFTYEKLSMAQINERLIELFVYSICTVKGHELFNRYKTQRESE